MDVLRPEWMLKRSDLDNILSGDISESLPKLIAPADVRALIAEAGKFKFPNPARIISVLMCKGGVGKTSTSFFLGQRLSMYGARVLLIDADPQGNLTSCFHIDQYGWEIDEETPILTDVLTQTCSLEEATIALTANLHLIPSTPLNSVLDAKIRDLHKNPALPIRKVLTGAREKYDYILFDCAPALNLTNTAIVGAATDVILPVAPDKFSEMGLAQTLKEIQHIEDDFNLRVAKRILLTRYDAREFTSQKYLAELSEKHRHLMLDVHIRTASDVKNVITRKEDLFTLSKSNAREDYDRLAVEVLGWS